MLLPKKNSYRYGPCKSQYFCPPSVTPTKDIFLNRSYQPRGHLSGELHHRSGNFIVPEMCLLHIYLYYYLICFKIVKRNIQIFSRL